MNTLSWFLYAASILPGVAKVAVAVFIASVIFILFEAFVKSVCAYDDLHSSRDIKASRAKDFLDQGGWSAQMGRRAKALWFVWVFAAFSMLIPSTETIYLIAGSEASEAVIDSEYGQQIIGDIQEVIRTNLLALKAEVNVPANEAVK